MAQVANPYPVTTIVMATPAPDTKLSALDQLQPRTYTSLVLSFPVSAERLTSATSHFRQGLERTVVDIPFLASDVVAASTRPGEVELRPRSARQSALFNVKDLTAAGSGWKHSYRELHSAYIPMSELDGNVLAPAGMVREEEAAAMAAQLNIIDGGCLLCVCVHRSVMDSTGVATCLRLWARRCRELQGAPEIQPGAAELEARSLDRRPLFGGEAKAEVTKHPAYKITQAPPGSKAFSDEAGRQSTLSTSSTAVAMFGIDMDTLIGFKHDMLEHLAEHGSDGAWVSSHDVLCAILWHAITAARSSSDIDESSSTAGSSRLGMAVEARTKLEPPLPTTYLGNASLYGTTARALSGLEESSLSSLAETALAVRRLYTSVDDAHIRSLIRLADHAPDPRAIQPKLESSLDKDLEISSMMELDVYDYEWGGFGGDGKVDYLRMPGAVCEGRCIILPRLADGAVEVVVGLKPAQMDRLKREFTFGRFAYLKSE